MYLTFGVLNVQKTKNEPQFESFGDIIPLTKKTLLRKLDVKKNNYKIYLKILERYFLAINYYLAKKNPLFLDLKN